MMVVYRRVLKNIEGNPDGDLGLECRAKQSKTKAGKKQNIAG